MIRTVPDALDGYRLDRAVSVLTGRSRTAASALVESGSVSVDGAPVTSRSSVVQRDQVLTIELPADDRSPELSPEPSVPLRVVHEDEHLAVIEKAAGLVVHPGAGHETGTLLHGLLARYPEMVDVGPAERPGIVHRLDRGTSGLLVVARTAPAFEGLVRQLADREIERRYDALVWGRVEEESGMVDAPIGRSTRDRTLMTVTPGGREARTAYRVAERFREPADLTRLTCRPETGRTHQIRVHLRAIGHPIVGDDRYGGSRSALPLERPFLHAAFLRFTHPVTGEALRFESALPADLDRVLGRLRLS